MSSETVTFKGYHGTDNSGERSIQKSKVYKYSNKDNEWLGTGIYFFIDSNEEMAINNAYRWATNYKKFSFYSILKTIVIASKDKVINLNDPEWQWIYHTYREEKSNNTISRGIKVETNKLKFDCEIINDICKKFDIDVVYQQRYINLSKSRSLVNSDIPNCIIMCVRKNDVIDKNSIITVKRGCNNG